VRAKDIFIRHATGLFEGDTLAAHSLLLNLTSTLTHRIPVPLGSLAMNIYSTSPEMVAKITAFVRSILPAVAVETMSIEALNKRRMYPKSDGETLSAGHGQLVPRTALLIDESKMQEGKLQDMGTSY
jgi:Mini-chromosome maintenance replisome factor